MSSAPVIAFGQQPCGIFPRRFLFAKFQTARRVQAELGGEIVFFYHDSDHDPRETKTILRHRKTNEIHTLNFAFENKLQRKYAPLYLKRVAADWQANTARQLPAFVEACWVEAFKNIRPATVADFCLDLYRAMGLLEGIRVVRSSDPAVRRAACAVDDYFVDVPFEGEVVRARCLDGKPQLHEGGDHYIAVPATDYGPEQISPSRDTRLRWMQSVIHCTHYIAGASEQHYLRREDAPEITYLNRDTIDCHDEAYVDPPA